MHPPFCSSSPLFRAPALVAFLAMLFSHAPHNSLADDARRFVLRFADGSYHAGPKLVNWHDATAQPQVEGRSLLDAGRPFRWLRDRSLAPGPTPSACVELITGDCLPGTVIAWSAAPIPWSPEPPCFIVQPAITLEPPEPSPRGTIRVFAGHVKRIIWERSREPLATPGTLRLRDGSTFSIRALRWEAGHVVALLKGGSRRFEFAELAEIYPPENDFWGTWRREVATLTPEGNSRLLALETVQGLSVTGSLERLAIHARGNAEESHKWFHGLQPAWSPDILWVPLAEVWLWQSYASHELPLHRVPVSRHERSSVLQPFSQVWLVNRNTRGEMLRSGPQEIGFGLGTGTSTNLVFSLPDEARELAGAVGLDRLAGSGGCARARIRLSGREPSVLWESPAMQGSSQVFDYRVSLPAAPANAVRELELNADALHEDRPSGSDPFEIRDYVDWLEPMLILDREAWQKAIDAQRSRVQLAGEGWNCEVPSGSEMTHIPVLDQRAPWPKSWLPALAVKQTCSWKQLLKPAPRDRWLIVYLHRLTDHEADPLLDVFASGEQIGSVKISRRHDHISSERPHVFPIGDFVAAGKPFEVELRVRNAHAASPLLLRAAYTSDRVPFAERVLDDFELPATHTSPTSPVFTTSEHRTGIRALQLVAGSEATYRFDPPIRIRSQPLPLEYRSLRLSVKKKGGGHVVLRWTGTFEGETAEHMLGRKPDEKTQFRMHNDAFKDDWVPVSHDLFNDFGAVELTSLTIAVPDGQLAWCDDICFGNSWEDFEFASRQRSDFPERNANLTSLLEKPSARAKQCIVQVDMGEGRVGAGVLFNQNNEVLTSGKLTRKADRQCTIVTSRGERLTAKTRGIFHDLDLAMIQLDKPMEVYGLGRIDWTTPSQQDVCLAVSLGDDGSVDTRIATIERYFEPEIWTSVPAERRWLGSPLLDSSGNVIAVGSRRSVTGNVIYSKLIKYGEIEARLRQGDVWGQPPQRQASGSGS